MDLTANAISQYKLNENAANYTVDDFLDNNEATLVGATTAGLHSAAANPPNLNGYFEFSTAEYINCGVSLSLNGLNRFSISTWVRLNSTTSYYLCGSVNSTGSTNFAIGLNTNTNDANATGNCYLYLRDHDGLRLHFGMNEDTGIADGGWHHMVWQCNINVASASGDLWIDGVQKSIYTKYAQRVDNVTAFDWPHTVAAVNLRGVITGKLYGALDNFVFFGAATGAGFLLDSDDVAYLYNSGVGTEELSSGIQILRRRIEGY